VSEATFNKINATEKQVKNSNNLFAKVIGEAIDLEPKERNEYIRTHYFSKTDEVIKFNNERIYEKGIYDSERLTNGFYDNGNTNPFYSLKEQTVIYYMQKLWQDLPMFFELFDGQKILEEMKENNHETIYINSFAISRPHFTKLDDLYSFSKSERDEEFEDAQIEVSFSTLSNFLVFLKDLKIIAETEVEKKINKLERKDNEW
jgi:hypothetical protein